MVKDRYPEHEETSFSYEDSIVVILDILGFKNKVFESQKLPANLKHIAELLGFIKAFNTQDGINEFIKLKNAIDIPNLQLNQDEIEKVTNEIQISHFSDSIAITLPYTESDFIKKISLIVYNLAWIISQLAMSDFFTRGGIAIGKMYHKENVFFGPAFLEAHNLESESEFAVNPRTILSKAIEEKLQKAGAINSVPYITKDDDKWWYVDFISFANDRDIKATSVYLEPIKDNVQKNIAECERKIEQTTSIKSKYEWLRNKIESI